jgi:hypothetical protein
MSGGVGAGRSILPATRLVLVFFKVLLMGFIIIRKLVPNIRISTQRVALATD